MALEIIAALLLGVVVGMITGLIPGLHVNLLSAILFASSAAILAHIGAFPLACFIIAISITHSFVEFITSIYLGAPDDSTALAVLPGHKLLLEGRGYEAVHLCVMGAWFGLLLLIIISPLLLIAIPKIFEKASPYIGWLLLMVSTVMIAREASMKGRIKALAVYLVAGALGCAVFALDVKQPLFPLLSGLFGVSTIIASISDKVRIPEQKLSQDISLGKKDMGYAVSSGLLSASVLSIFPGLGPAQAAIISTQFYRKIKEEAYLVVVGSINSISMAMSLLTLYAIEKARNGSIVVVQNILPSFGLSELAISLVVALCAASLAIVLTLALARTCSRIMPRLPYAKISYGVLMFIVALVFFISGLLGVFILVVSAAVGMIPLQWGIGRHHAMGVLLLPIILYFLL